MKTAVMIFGRFQPPTIGHNFLFKTLMETCYQWKSDGYIFISPTVDSKKNPLTLEYRYDLLTSLYPYLDFISHDGIKNPLDAICFLGNFGFERVVIVAGSDRTEKFNWLQKYINHPDPEKNLRGIKELNVVVCPRKKDTDLISRVSATDARKFSLEGNLQKFETIVTTRGIDTIKLYDSIVKGMMK